MSENRVKWLPLAILPTTESYRSTPDLPIAYIPKGTPSWTRRPTPTEARRGRLR
ncbi:MAG: hypothetical protein L3J95_02710 [Thermoplasmata archaeon]|nr:hypothetical protein [Thermoplasmata archaeon]MCI4359319.1 hypothetical protein [Thermoplasmata archaeon]